MVEKRVITPPVPSSESRVLTFLPVKRVVNRQLCLCLCTPFCCFQLISLSLISYSAQVPEVLMRDEESESEHEEEGEEEEEDSCAQGEE